MTAEHALIDDIRAALQPHGLLLRGTVHFDAAETGPLLDGGGCARSILLIGNVGGSIWPAFERWRAARGPSAHPLDDWSKAVIRPVAAVFGATVFFPSDPPFQPFQRWAMRAEGLKASPLGILIHPDFGLWHGYRAALAFGCLLPQTGSVPAVHPCDRCRDRPCLSHCPADAVTDARFDVAACRAHLAEPAGQRGCMSEGCVIRARCPVGVDYRYAGPQLRFHMAALGGL